MKIICNNEGCSTVFKAARPNKIYLEKFGSLENFRKKWICRSCLKKLKQKKEENIDAPVKWAKKQNKSQKKTELINFIEKKKGAYRLNSKEKSRSEFSIDLVENPEVCQEVTQYACWRPDIYLNYGCDKCQLVVHCACPSKRKGSFK